MKGDGNSLIDNDWPTFTPHHHFNTVAPLITGEPHRVQLQGVRDGYKVSPTRYCGSVGD